MTTRTAALALLLSLRILAQETGFAGRDPEYRLQPNDTIEVQYRYTPEYNTTAAIQPDGSIALPVTGSVKVAGMTPRTAAQAIAAKASERLRDPEVSVLLKDFVKPYFTLAGEIVKPGRYDLRGNVTVIEALAQGGWLTRESARHSQILLVRRKDEEWGEIRVFNLKAAADRGRFQEDMTVRPGDMIYVPQNFLSKLDRYFRWTTLANLGLLIR